ncbi:MAG: LUD domain-containing protein [Chloroflexota bacterium]|nr:LUD domain-containing protein [Chloroflexota bacterium]
MSHAVAPFKKRLRDALESDSLPMALGRVLPLLDGRRREAFDGRDFPAEQARLAAIRKRDVANGPRLLEQFTEVAEKAGMVVHPPADAAAVRETVAELLRNASARMVVKSKSMATEEIGLNQALEADGVEVVETDLGEFLVQVADELPSHIVAPALHITRERAAELIGSVTGQDLPPDPDTLVRAAREYLRDKFIAADAGITGANALVASTGSVMLVSNEGNARLCSSLPSLHIVVAGVDKLVATMTDAAATLDMLPASATGQTMSSYVSFISGPSRSADIEMSLSLGVHGPRDVHVVLLDNGREAMRRDPKFQTALQCVRCGACSNVCPTYQQVGGHAMGHIYTGPIGLLLTSFHHGMENVAGPQALCAGCGACATVCPAGIPIPELIQEVRTRAVADGAAKNRLKSLALGVLADSRAFEKGLRTFTRIPGAQALARRLPGSPLRARPLPPVSARPFRDRLPALAADDGAKAQVAYFPGCLTDWLAPETGEAAVSVLGAIAPVVFESCCGLPAINAGYRAPAVRMAKQTIAAIERSGVETVVSTSTSCLGAIRDDYPRLFADEPEWRERALAAAGRLVDFATYVEEHRLAGVPAHRARGVVTVHDACQSRHGLGLGTGTRRLLTAAGYTVREAPYSGECCGFGGSFSFDFPEVAGRMRQRKLEAFASTGATLVCGDNPGCLLHLDSDGATPDAPRPVHLAELLRDAAPDAT